MNQKANKHQGLSFDQHVQMAVQAAIKSNIQAEVTEATMIVAQETRKALSSMKMRLDALESVLIKKNLLTSEDLKLALWETQETLFGLTVFDGVAANGNGLRIRVKEEEVGKETDAEPNTESYVILGTNEVSKEIDEVLQGAKAGDTKTLTMEDTRTEPKEGETRPKYLITIKVDRVYTKKEDAKN